MSLQSQGLPVLNGSSATCCAGSPDARPRKVDIVWNTTLVCPWDCSCCCVDAVYVSKQGSRVILRSRGLELSESIPFDDTRGTIFDQAASKRQRDGRELTLAQKLRVLDHFDGFDPKLDISGGDPLSIAENYELLKSASTRFGRRRITLTATGAGLSRYRPDEVGPLIGELNFTYDGTRANPTDLRPAKYAEGNLARAKQFASLGVATRAECPLSTQNANGTMLDEIYLNLHDAGIDTLLVMRLFPSGRGCNVAAATPSPSQHRAAIARLRNIEARYGRPRLKLQCALRFMDDSTVADNPCDLLRESFGLMADGTLLASPWAIGPTGRPLDDVWVLGNLAEHSLAHILESERAERFYARLDENFGHCKLHAFVNSPKRDPLERIFDGSDPLYAPAASFLAEVR